MAGPMARCMREKKQVVVKDPKYFATKNGAVMAKGVCSTPGCGCKVAGILKKDKIPAGVHVHPYKAKVGGVDDALFVL